MTVILLAKVLVHAAPVHNVELRSTGCRSTKFWDTLERSVLQCHYGRLVIGNAGNFEYGVKECKEVICVVVILEPLPV